MIVSIGFCKPSLGDGVECMVNWQLFDRPRLCAVPALSNLAASMAVARQRIASAVALLGTQEHSITEISHRVGFRTVSHFTTVFRRVTGTTPGAFRATALQDKRPGRGGSDDLP